MPFGLDLPDVDLDIPNPLDLMPDVELPKLPDISMPDISMPDISMPDISMPDLSLPDISMPEIGNPLDHIPSIPNPIDLLPDLDLPDFELPKDPLQPVIDDIGGRIDKGKGMYDAITEGEKNTNAPEGVAKEEHKNKAKWQEKAYESLGIDKATFDTMDPIQRNGLINAAYAKMYKKDPETYKWAGMAAMASDKAGTGMMQTYMLEGAELVPGVDAGAGALGAPGGKEVRDLLAIGNGGIFNDMMWQHLAFDSGGMGEMQKAFKEGSISEHELKAWQKIADSKEALQKAKESGDPAAIKAAQSGIWEGNGALLYHEQKNVQNIVYDKPGGKEAFEFLSSGYNVMGVTSPVPGGTKFGDYRDGKEGTDNVANFDQRWGWIEDKMMPEYKQFESDPAKMNAEMDKYIKREKKNQWDEKAWDPANDIVKKAGGPVSGPFMGMF